MYVCMYVFTQPLQHKQDVTQGQFLSEVVLVCIQFKVKESGLHFCLHIARRREN